jgi:hypothetical protein
MVAMVVRGSAKWPTEARSGPEEDEEGWMPYDRCDFCKF